MARLSASEYAEKWARRLSGASEDVKKGIGRVTEAPGVKAAANQEAMRINLNKSIDDGTWAAQTRKVSLEDWKKAAIDKGTARLASGVQAAQASQVPMAEKLLAAVDASVAEANQIKRGDLEANVQRMTTFVRGMAKRKLRRPGA